MPIGLPISNTTAYVLNGELNPVAVSETGELFIGGEGLSRGYSRRPDLTAEAFIPNPFGSAGSRLYRTGDMVRRTADGLLIFVGRSDFQVKVNGYRIELEEVEEHFGLTPMFGRRQCLLCPRRREISALWPM